MKFNTFSQYTDILGEARRGPTGTDPQRAQLDFLNDLKKWFPRGRLVKILHGDLYSGKVDTVIDIHGQGRQIVTMGYDAAPRDYDQGRWKPLAQGPYRGQ